MSQAQENYTKINSAELAEHRSVNGVTTKDGKPWTLVSFEGPIPSKDGSSKFWVIKGRSPGGKYFYTYLPDSPSRHKQYAEISGGTRYKLVLKEFKNWDNEDRTFYFFEEQK